MPETTTKLKGERKTQPWRVIWPAPETAQCCQMERKAICGGSDGNTGSFGYVDKDDKPEDDGTAPKK